MPVILPPVAFDSWAEAPENDMHTRLKEIRNCFDDFMILIV
jgi:hypothetical protein